MKTLTGDGGGAAVKAGATYTTTWNVAKDYPTFNSSAFAVTVRAVARTELLKRQPNKWYANHDLNSRYIAGVNNDYAHYTETAQAADAVYHDGHTISLPMTVYVKVSNRPADSLTGQPGERPLIKAVLQWKVLPSGKWCTAKTLEKLSWALNYKNPVALLGKNVIPYQPWPAGTEILVRVYLSDGIYETGDLNADITSPIPDSATRAHGGVYEGGWTASFVCRAVLSGRERPH